MLLGVLPEPVINSDGFRLTVADKFPIAERRKSFSQTYLPLFSGLDLIELMLLCRRTAREC